MNLKTQMRELRSLIENFCFHKREKLIIEMLWSEASNSHKHHFGPRALRLHLIKLIDEQCEVDVPDLQAILARERLHDQIETMVTYQPDGRS